MNRALAPGYDLFKLVVTLLLAVLVIILLLHGYAPSANAQTPSPPPEKPTLTKTRPPSNTATSSPSPLPQPTTTASLPPSPTAQPTPTTAPTPTPETTTAAAPTPQTGPANPDCPGAAVSRIKVGDRVRVLTHLNLRRDPALNGAWILTHLTGTELEVIGGPGCTHIGQLAYQWWQVRRPDGKEGWSAEASLRGQFYFLEPIP